MSVSEKVDGLKLGEGQSREFLEKFVLPMVEDALHSTMAPHQNISEVTRLLELVIMGIDQEIILLKR